MRRKRRAAPVVLAPMERFDWAILDLLKPGSTALRGTLKDIESAIRKGRFAGDEMAPKRAALLNALAGLGDSQLSPRVAVRYARVYALLTGSDPGMNHAPQRSPTPNQT
jgi:hypothetical protein